MTSRKGICVFEMWDVNLIVGWNELAVSRNLLRVSLPWVQIMKMSSI